MPQVVLLLAIGAGCYAGYKALRTVLAPVMRTADIGSNDRAASVKAAESGPRNLGALEWDEHEKVYRPKV